MANAADSVLVAAQAKFNERMLGAEWRLPDSAAILAANKAEMANPLLAEIRTSESRTVTAKFPIRQAATSGTVRVAEHTGNNPDTNSETISWSKFVEDFSISRGLAENNVYEFMELYTAGKRNAILNLLSRVDASFVASVLADESTASAGGASGTFNATTDEYEIPQTEKDNFFWEVKAMLEENTYRGRAVGLINAKANVLKNRLAAQGAANDVNSAVSLLGFEDLIHTTRTITSSTNDAAGLFWENGLLGVNFWVPPKNRKPINMSMAMGDSVGDFGQFTIPEFPGITFAHSIYARRSDQSASGGNEQDVLIHEEISLEMAYVSAPVSSFQTETSPVFNAILLT